MGLMLALISNLALAPVFGTISVLLRCGLYHSGQRHLEGPSQTWTCQPPGLFEVDMVEHCGVASAIEISCTR